MLHAKEKTTRKRRIIFFIWGGFTNANIQRDSIPRDGVPIINYPDESHFIFTFGLSIIAKRVLILELTSYHDRRDKEYARMP
jgi:hypothetical protein